MAAVRLTMINAKAAAATVLVWTCNQLVMDVDHRSMAGRPRPVGLWPVTAGHQ